MQHFLVFFPLESIAQFVIILNLTNFNVVNIYKKSKAKLLLQTKAKKHVLQVYKK